MVKNQQNSFACVPRSVIEKMPEIGAYALAVYVILVDHANENGECWPSRERLAERAGISLSSVGRHVRSLVDRGLIAVRNRPDGPNPRSNLYEVLDPYKPNGSERPVCSPNGSERPAKQVTETFSNGSERPKNKNHRTRTKNNKGMVTASVIIPDSLRSDAFTEAWGEWVAHKREIRNPLTDRAARMTLKKLEAMGPSRAVAAIEHSIANGYKGVFEPSTIGKKPNESVQEPIKYRNIHAR